MLPHPFCQLVCRQMLRLFSVLTLLMRHVIFMSFLVMRTLTHRTILNGHKDNKVNKYGQGLWTKGKVRCFRILEVVDDESARSGDSSSWAPTVL